MDLLIDLFGYLSIVVHGLTILAQSIALGGVFFLALLARPLAPHLGTAGAAVVQGTQRIAAWGAVALLLCEATTVALQTAVLVGTVDLSVTDVLAAQFAIAGLIKMAIAGVIAALLFVRAARAPVPLLAGLALVELAAATLTTHAVARLDDRVPLLVVEWLHQFGAAIWIGGIPCFLLALRRVEGGAAWRLVGARFSRMSMAGVACILASGATMLWFYVGNLQGFYGTAYGVMVGAKIAMFLLLLVARRHEFPARRTPARQSRHAGPPAAALRGGRDRHRRVDLLCRRVADLGAAGGGPDAGPGELAGNPRAQHPGMAAPEQP